MERAEVNNEMYTTYRERRRGSEKGRERGREREGGRGIMHFLAIKLERNLKERGKEKFV